MSDTSVRLICRVILKIARAWFAMKYDWSERDVFQELSL